MFPLAGIDRSEFLRTYWRQRPLFVRGGAAALGVSLDEETYRRAADDLERVHPELVRRGDDGLLACQNISSVEPGLGSWLAGVMREMSWPTAWMDAVYAESESGIGGHFDDSDNMVLQQAGTKIWTLRNRSGLDPELLRATMVRGGEAETAVTMPDDDVIEFRLEAGDLLYIPLLWGHQGVSSGRSLSMSLVCNAENALSLMPLIHWAVSERRDWWDALPVPDVHDTGPGAEQRVPEDVVATIAERLASLSEPGAVRAVAELWWSARVEKMRELDDAAVPADR